MNKSRNGTKETLSKRCDRLNTAKGYQSFNRKFTVEQRLTAIGKHAEITKSKLPISPSGLAF